MSCMQANNKERLHRVVALLCETATASVALIRKIHEQRQKTRQTHIVMHTDFIQHHFVGSRRLIHPW